MALPRYKTLGELRVQLARACGYTANPDSAVQPLMIEHLQTAQVQIYERINAWARVVGDFNIDTVAGTWRYEWPSGLDSDRVQYVYARYDDDEFVELIEGFSVTEYDLRENYRDYPTRYRRRDMLEIFPTPDQVYRLIVGAQNILAPFGTDSDRATVPDDMVLNQAAVFAFEAMGRPPPIARMRAVEMRISQLRARSHDRSYYTAGPHFQPLSRPRIAGLEG